jgi:hypothetical protein
MSGDQLCTVSVLPEIAAFANEIMSPTTFFLCPVTTSGDQQVTMQTHPLVIEAANVQHHGPQNPRDESVNAELRGTTRPQKSAIGR